MKKFLLIVFLASAAALADAGAQTQAFSVPASGRDGRVQRRTPPVPVRRGEIGAFPRAARGGNPLQLINPKAPQKYYGAPQDTVTWDPSNPSRITGLILFGFAW